MPLQNTAPHPPTPTKKQTNKQTNKKIEPVEYPFYYPVKIIGLSCLVVLPWIICRVSKGEDDNHSDRGVW